VLIRLDDVELRQGGFTLRCTGTFAEGVHLVSGPVGSGKSTLALLLASLTVPDRGGVRREGINSALLSLQFPEYHVTAATVADEVRSWGLDPDDVLSQAGLADRDGIDPLLLSRGQLKQLNLACVFAKDPDLLLLDEPFGSLDCAAKVRACRMIEERTNGITIIFSHERSVLPRVTMIAEMESGRLVECGRVPDAIARWRGAPPYLRYALEAGARPRNITLTDAREALCRIRD
jgi:energy-coupling factor transport system ATP-binding protein